MLKYFYFFLVGLLGFTACSPKISAPQKLYNKQIIEIVHVIETPPPKPSATDSVKPAPTFIGTPNFGMRIPNMVVIHHTAQDSCEQTLRTFTDTARKVSAHYVICKDGTVHHMLSDYLRAWHAGRGSWGNDKDINSVSVGIELDNNGSEPFPEAQMNALLSVLRSLKDTFKIPAANFVGHADIAPGRKVDPSKYFSWNLLATQGFGLWYSGDTASVTLPIGFDVRLALRIIGYDISNLPAARQAFRLHFLGKDNTDDFDEGEKKILYIMMQKYL